MRARILNSLTHTPTSLLSCNDADASCCFNFLCLNKLRFFALSMSNTDLLQGFPMKPWTGPHGTEVCFLACRTVKSAMTISSSYFLQQNLIIAYRWQSSEREKCSHFALAIRIHFKIARNKIFRLAPSLQLTQSGSKSDSKDVEVTNNTNYRLLALFTITKILLQERYYWSNIWSSGW